MATLEVPLDEELAVSPPDNASQTFERWDLEIRGLEPWKQGSNPETAAGAEWLFEIMMA
jgi:hypothetical protein